jgi:hypothetical protein
VNGLAHATSIVVANSAAVVLIVYGIKCGCPWGMNACWIAALVFLYAPAVLAMRDAGRTA